MYIFVDLCTVTDKQWLNYSTLVGQSYSAIPKTYLRRLSMPLCLHTDDLSWTGMSNYMYLNPSLIKCEVLNIILVVSISGCLLLRCRNAFWGYRNANLRW